MTRSFTLGTTVEVPASAADAWSVIADYRLDPQWRKGVVTMEPSPAGLVQVGTTTAEVLRLGGRTYRNDGEVVGVEPGRSFRWRTTSGADASGSRSVTALAADRSRVELSVTVTPHGAQRLMAPVLRRLLARNLAGDGDRLCALLLDRASLRARQPVNGALAQT